MTRRAFKNLIAKILFAVALVGGITSSYFESKYPVAVSRDYGR
jgi:hypothetical protein